VKGWIAAVDSDELFLSVLVVGEIRQGVERLRHRDPAQATVFEGWLAALRRDYGDRVLPITMAVAEEWGRLNAADPLPVVDGLLAATAKVHDLTLVTRNTSQVEGTGARLLNPFA
jgi:predicted nucleic acid-binding protein